MTITAKEAGNIAWHINVNGLDENVTPAHIAGLAKHYEAESALLKMVREWLKQLDTRAGLPALGGLAPNKPFTDFEDLDRLRKVLEVAN